MNNKYNVLVTYSGDGDFKFNVRRIGEVNISRTKPIYIYNADMETINDIRILRRLLINVKIGAKPTGAFKVFNMDDYDRPRPAMSHDTVVIERQQKEPLSNEVIANIQKGGIEDVVTKEDTSINDEIHTDTAGEETKDTEEETVTEIQTPKKKTTKKTTKRAKKKTSKK